MASGFRSNGVDLDDIFAAYISGAKPGNIGLRVGGQDLRDRYQPYTAGPKVAVTGFRVDGVDLRDIFSSSANLLTPVYSGQKYQDFDSNSSGPSTASVTVLWNSDGSFSGGGFGPSGLWYNSTSAGIGAGYELRLTPTLGYIFGPFTPSVNNSAASFTSMAANKAITITLTSTGGGAIARYLVLAEIRIAGGGPIVSSHTLVIEVNPEAD